MKNDKDKLRELLKKFGVGFKEEDGAIVLETGDTMVNKEMKKKVFILEIEVPYHSYGSDSKDKVAETSMKKYILHRAKEWFEYVEIKAWDKEIDCSVKTKIKIRDFPTEGNE